eukprot:6302498-Lingulodinium_polyedra.AAC.1
MQKTLAVERVVAITKGLASHEVSKALQKQFPVLTEEQLPGIDSAVVREINFVARIARRDSMLEAVVDEHSALVQGDALKQALMGVADAENTIAHALQMFPNGKTEVLAAQVVLDTIMDVAAKSQLIIAECESISACVCDQDHCQAPEAMAGWPDSIQRLCNLVANRDTHAQKVEAMC